MHKISIALHIAMPLMLVLLEAYIFLLFVVVAFLHVGIVLKEQGRNGACDSYRNGLTQLSLRHFHKMGLISTLKCSMRPCFYMRTTFCTGKLFHWKSNLPSEDGLTKDRSEG